MLPPPNIYTAKVCEYLARKYVREWEFADLFPRWTTTCLTPLELEVASISTWSSLLVGRGLGCRYWIFCSGEVCEEALLLAVRRRGVLSSLVGILSADVEAPIRSKDSSCMFIWRFCSGSAWSSSSLGLEFIRNNHFTKEILYKSNFVVRNNICPSKIFHPGFTNNKIIIFYAYLKFWEVNGRLRAKCDTWHSAWCELHNHNDATFMILFVFSTS